MRTSIYYVKYDKLCSIFDDRRLQFLVDNCSPLVMHCTVNDTKSTLTDWLRISQVSVLYECRLL